MTTAQRRYLAILIGVAGAVLLAASAAYACGVLATLQLSDDHATVGQTVTAHGTGFRDGEPNVVSDVVLTLDRRDGLELWRGRAAADRTVTAEFVVPDVEPGYHIVFATQYFADGSPVAGTPARATIEVVAAPASASTAQSDDRSAQRSARGTSDDPATGSGADDGATATTTTSPATDDAGVAGTRTEATTATAGRAGADAGGATHEGATTTAGDRAATSGWLTPEQRSLLATTPRGEPVVTPPVRRAATAAGGASAVVSGVALDEQALVIGAVLSLLAVATVMAGRRRAGPHGPGPVRAQAPG